MAEKWDIYNINRQRIGQTYKKPSSWEHDFYHLIVHVAIFDTYHRMLIQRRSPIEHSWANLWDISAGGRVWAGEESWQAAERETYEELGISLQLHDIRPHFTINYEQGFNDFFAIELDNLNLSSLNLQSSEVSEVKWATLEDIHQMLQAGTFVPYFPGLIDLLWQVKDNYDGAIKQKSSTAE